MYIGKRKSSFVEVYITLCPYVGGSTIRGFTYRTQLALYQPMNAKAVMSSRKSIRNIWGL